MTASQPESGSNKKVAITLNKWALGFAKNWAAFLTVGFLIYAGLPFVAPIAMKAGATNVARVIYGIYQPLCHQFTFRSWFLFGEQTTYPRDRAGLGNGSFEEFVEHDPHFDGIDVHSLDAQLIFADRSFVGNEEMGFKVAYCQRDIAIYGMIALGSLLYFILSRSGVKVPYLPFWAYILIAIVPIGLDGFSQMFANPPFSGFGLPIYPIRESTPFLRVLTGALFGLGNLWLAYPYIDESMRETRIMVETKLINAGVIAKQ